MLSDDEVLRRLREDPESIVMRGGEHFVDSAHGPSFDDLEWTWVRSYPVSELFKRVVSTGGRPFDSRRDAADWYESERDGSGNPGYYEELDASVARSGVDDELSIAELEDGRIDILDGWHRFALALKHGLKTVPVFLGRIRKNPEVRKRKNSRGDELIRDTYRAWVKTGDVSDYSRLSQARERQGLIGDLEPDFTAAQAVIDAWPKLKRGALVKPDKITHAQAEDVARAYYKALRWTTVRSWEPGCGRCKHPRPLHADRLVTIENLTGLREFECTVSGCSCEQFEFANRGYPRNRDNEWMPLPTGAMVSPEHDRYVDFSRRRVWWMEWYGPTPPNFPRGYWSSQVSGEFWETFNRRYAQQRREMDKKAFARELLDRALRTQDPMRPNPGLGDFVWHTGRQDDLGLRVRQWKFFDGGVGDSPIWVTPDMDFARKNAGYHGFVYLVRFEPKKLFPETPLLELVGSYLETTSAGTEVLEALGRGEIFPGLSPDDAFDTLKAIDRGDYDVMETKAMVDWLVRRGYDAMVVTGDGPTNVAVLDPTKIEVLAIEPATPGHDPRSCEACVRSARRQSRP